MKKILIIDDEPNIVVYLKTLLEDHGYAVVTAFDPEEGLRIAHEEFPDLICLDIMMPKKSGVTLYRELKKEKKLKQIPVIIISGVENAYSFREPKFRQLIPDKRIPEPLAFFEKPVDVPGLIALLAKTLKT
jgi:CheY-like chemotaxis protein